MARRKNVRTAKRVARGGAAAFAAGLFLAGPQAAGIAAADTQGDGNSATAGAADSTAGPANRASTPRRGAAPARRGTANQAGSAAPEQPVTTTRGSRGAAAEPPADLTVPDIAPPAAATTQSRSASATQAPAVTTTTITPPQLTRLAPAPTPGISLGPAAIAPPAATGPAAPVAISAAPAGGLLPALLKTQGQVAPGASAVTILDAVVNKVSGGVALSPASAPASLTAIRDKRLAEVNGNVRKFFTALSDALDRIPSNDLRANLEGALLVVRRSILNQNAVACPIQTSFDPTNPGAGITGDVMATDPEGEVLNYTVLTAPQRGTVVFDAYGNYLYTPGKDFTGQDAFTVQVTSEGKGINIFGLGRGRATQAVVQVGADAPTSPFDYKDSPANKTLFMNEVPVVVSVSKDAKNLAGLYKASITVKVAPDSPVEWAVKNNPDEIVQQKNNPVPISKASAEWDSLKSAGAVRLGVDFTLPDGRDAAMIMTDVTAEPGSGPGTYTFSGYIATDPTDGPGTADSNYDVVGNSYNSAYDNFRSYYKVPLPGEGSRSFNGAEIKISAGNVYADTWTKQEYGDALKEAEIPGGSAATSQSQQSRVRSTQPTVAASAASPAADQISTAGGESAGVEVSDATSSGPLADPQVALSSTKAIKQVISCGTGMVILRADGQITLWTPGETKLGEKAYQGPDGKTTTSTSDGTTVLRNADGNAAWGDAKIAPFKDGFMVALQDGTVWQWTSGAAVADLTDYITDRAKVIAVNDNLDQWGPENAVDNKPATASATSFSKSPDEPASGAGSGLIIDLGQPMIATGLKLTSVRSEDTASDPLSYEVYGAEELVKDSAGNTDSTAWKKISEGALTLGTGAEGYVRPKNAGGYYQQDYNSVTFKLPNAQGAESSTPDPTQVDGFQFYKVVFPDVRGDSAQFVKIAELELPGYLPEPSWQRMPTLSWPKLGPFAHALPVSTVVPFGNDGGVAVGFGSAKEGLTSEGGVQVWDPKSAQWRTMVEPKEGGAVTAMIAYKDGIAFGDQSGHVTEWTSAGGGKTRQVKELTAPIGPMSGAITAIMPYGGGLVVGTDRGYLRQWTGFEWAAANYAPLDGGIQAIQPYEHGFVVGTNGPGNSAWWTGTGWVQLGWAGQGVNAMAAPEKNGVAFGLKNDTKDPAQVLQWRAAPVADVTDWMAQTPSAFTLFQGKGAVIGTAGGPVAAFDNNPETNVYIANSGVGLSTPGNKKGFGVDLGTGNSAVVTGLRLTLTPQYAKSIPTSYALYGANPGYSTYTLISSGVLARPTLDKPDVEVAFQNATPYQSYRVVFPDTTDPTADQAFRVAEIALVGSREWSKLPKMKPTVIGEKEIPEGDVTTMTDFDSGFVVGLGNSGAVNRWVGGDAPQGKAAAESSPWKVVQAGADPDPNFNQTKLKEEVKYGYEHSDKPVVKDGVFNAEDPVFSQVAFQPRCAADHTCDGNFYTFNTGGEAKPLKLPGLGEAKISSTVGDVTAELSFDAGTSWRGYVFVPSGLWRKLNPGEYTAASVMAVTAGPSMSVTVDGTTQGKETSFTIAETPLLNLSYTIPNVVSFAFGAGVDAGLVGKLTTTEVHEGPFKAHAYYTAGVLSTYNTAASDGFDFSFKSYSDVGNDFAKVESVTFNPYVTPYVSADVGMFTPRVPILGRFSVFDAGAKFENPLGAELTFAKSGTTRKVYSEGKLDFGVHVLPFLTSALSYDDSLEVYRVSGDL